MLTGRRYLLAFTPEQETFAERIGDACRMVWNTGLEQRRAYRRRGAFVSYVEQARQMAEAKKDFPWLAEAPSHTLQQTLRDLERACKTHGTWRVKWRSRRMNAPTFRFPDPRHISVERISRRWGRVKLPKLGWVRFRWTRPLGGQLRNATVLKDGGRWYISFCVEDGIAETTPNGKPAVGVDRGVKVAVATSDGTMRDRWFVTPGEAARMRRLQQQLARQRKGSNRRAATRAKLARLNARVRNRRSDFLAWTADRLTRDHGLVVVEDLKIKSMTASAKGTGDAPGRGVRQKAGLNRAILSKGWGGLLDSLEHKARYNGSRVVRVPPAYTSQRCSACGAVDAKSRESQAVFACTSCAHTGNADVNAAKNILAAGLAVTGRGDLADGRSVKRQPPEVKAA
ncbi:RNA-guided endonuclease InsQ/TnpB family protein [Streptosporangium saharense]|uniref:RNA-guided endonuclease InsQ/TnpB family protein n=1 Tax=Streptosporangium saharense TaxID=1706840 RepID=UPI00368A6B60